MSGRGSYSFDLFINLEAAVSHLARPEWVTGKGDGALVIEGAAGVGLKEATGGIGLA